MTNYEKLRREGERIDDVIRRLLREKDICRRFCAVPVKNFTECKDYRCSDRIRIFLESEVRSNAARRA